MLVDSGIKFLQSHQQMGVAYRKGYQAFVASGHDHRSGDTAVKGIDRAPTKLLEQAAEKIAVNAEQATSLALDMADASSSTSLIGTLLVLSVGIMLSILFVQRIIVAPMGEIVHLLERFAKGDFEASLTLEQSDEVGRVAQAANNMREQIGAALHTIKDAALSLDQAREQLAVVSEDNHAKLGSQHEESSQVATATEQMAATAQDVAQSAANASAAATRVQGSTVSGEQVVVSATQAIDQVAQDVDQVNTVLRGLEERSDSIGSVLDVIRGIAEQTNLLALNAAIEAARAGDQGRGFAVVADEVRSLAQRTQESTQEIQKTIEQVQGSTKAAVQAMANGRERVNESVQRTAEIGQALKEISDEVIRIVDVNAQISTAAQQQGVVSQDVSRNINNVDQLSRDMVETSSQVRNASEQISDLSSRLVQTTAHFNF